MIHGFQVENWKARVVGFPMEDSFRVDKEKGIIAVADGITQDCTSGRVPRKSLSGAFDIRFNYPNPSRAKEIADFFTSQAVDYVSNYLSFKDGRGKPANADNMDRIFKATFLDINHLINFMNRGEGINYDNVDYLSGYPPGCAAALVYSRNDEIFWSYLADCGVAIVSPKGDLKARTKDEGPDGPGKIRDEGDEIELAGGWKSKEGRTLIRKKFRNNPLEVRAVGILNGMPEAVSYIKTGTFEINSWDYLLVYTDGVADIIFKEDGDIESEVANKFRQFDLTGLEKLCKSKVSSQGTLVIKR